MSIRAAAILLLLICIGQKSFSQSGFNSPYSRYGLGDLHSEGLTHTRGIGAGTSLGSYFYANTLNPALVQKTKHNVFEVGAQAHYKSLQTSEEMASTSDGTLSFFAFSFSGQGSTQKWYNGRWSALVALQPYSNMNYNIGSFVDVRDENGNTTGETIYNTDEGYGYLNKVMLSNAFRIIDQTRNRNIEKPAVISLGLETSYLFGSLEKRSTSGDVDAGAYAVDMRKEFYRGFYLKPGLSFRKPFAGGVDSLKNIRGGDSLVVMPLIYSNFGITASGLVPIQMDYEKTVGYYQSSGLPLDTAVVSSVDGQSVNLPSTIRFGISFDKPQPAVSRAGVKNDLISKSTWQVGADFWTTNWDNYSNDFDLNTYSNTIGFALGGEFCPNLFGNSLTAENGFGARVTDFFARTLYRGGFSYETLPYQPNGQELTDIGINLGFGLPLSRFDLDKRYPKYLNITLNYGVRGDVSNGLIQDNYFKILLSFNTMNNSWFKKYAVGL